MTAPADHLIKIYVDATTYMALRYRCEQVDRSMSQHIRHLIRSDLSTAAEDEKGRGRGGS